jgi:hypothetical protein
VTIIPPPEPEIESVVIQFEGICVNFSRLSFPLLPTAHRIVLINASEITEVWKNPIEKHHAGFSTDLDPNKPMFPLNGAVVQIVNPITTAPLQSGVTYDPSYKNIPSLTTLTPDLSPVSLAVLVGHNPALTACYFDVDYGTISSVKSTYGAWMTQVTILTDGAPMYLVTPFSSKLSSPPLPLLDSPQFATNSMYFWNEEDSPAGAKNVDFMLSYLVLSAPPINPPNLPPPSGWGSAVNRKTTVLGAPAASEREGLQLEYTDVGCSNSAFP